MQTHTIKCARSGVPLFHATPVCSNQWALLSYPHFKAFVHPIYEMPLDKLLRKLTLQLLEAETAEWNISNFAVREIGLTMSSIMYALGAMWTPTVEALEHGRLIEHSLPDAGVTVGCAGRLLSLASWYHNETSKRITFPLWRPSKHAGNLNWHGYPNWLNACFDIKEDWGKQKRKHENAELLRATEETLKTVHLASVYKKIDTAKVWNWISIQASEHQVKYPSGRQETLKTLFLRGDVEPEAWLPDDCDDLIEMVTDCCDIGNDIMFFIRQRTSLIRSYINDFYGNFTMLDSKHPTGDGGLSLSAAEQDAQSALMSEYTSKLEGLTTAPAEPKLEAYPSRVHWLRAQAEWRLLTKVFKLQNQPTKQPNSTGADDAI